MNRTQAPGSIGDGPHAIVVSRVYTYSCKAVCHSTPRYPLNANARPPMHETRHSTENRSPNRERSTRKSLKTWRIFFTMLAPWTLACCCSRCRAVADARCKIYARHTPRHMSYPPRILYVSMRCAVFTMTFDNRIVNAIANTV